MSIFTNADCIELHVDDLDEGLAYYCGALGLKLLWWGKDTVGLGMENDITEVVLQTERHINVDFKVEDVLAACEVIKKAGGRIIYGPWDIDIGKAALVRDKWENEYVILDMTKGKYTTDENGNVTGVAKQ